MLEKVRSMLSEYGLPGEFWAEAVNTAVYLVNLSLSSAINFSTPSELRHKRMADYSRLKVFGCTTYLLTPKEHRTKLDPTSKKCHFLGYTSGVKGYRLWDPLAHRDGMALILEEDEPSSYREAQTSVNKLEWNAHMKREMDTLIDNKTWELVETPTNQTLIDFKWVYKLKDNPGGDETRIFKARLLARAFLYRYLEELIYMRQLVGYEVKGKERLVCRLLKSLYGLKQAPRQWNTRFDEFMKAQGFLRSVYDPCVYMKKVNDETFNLIILVLYVDDMLILAKNQSDVDECKSKWKSAFKMKDMGESKRILGMEIHGNHEQKRLWLNQGKYVRRILDRFNMINSKGVWTPLAANFKLSVAQCLTDAVEKENISCVPYEQALDSLMYLMMCTRLDIAFAMGKLNQQRKLNMWQQQKQQRKLFGGYAYHGNGIEAERD
ncbi:hypothetical protein AXG93_1129s1070 [Marchantia polymorpha subsp. ruderalis]|uniref:Uncharacterized protein n=1 Tax=Marchantia polymorpha subsp. ruderalis TaxID=1480154 RepID=A0A176W151_MARPO|nr:hypothetical protein AXG93_1129s1070 [Marchantia polymorpha subsp. ruderalis]